MGRCAILQKIERLDPERDNQRILHLSFGYEFSWDSTRALELALYRCASSIFVRTRIREAPHRSRLGQRSQLPV